jgi:uncharacterized protein (UPF0333 family)
MREFLLNNKGKIIRLAVLLFVFLVVVAYINGRSIYQEKNKMIKDRTANISLRF